MFIYFSLKCTLRMAFVLVVLLSKPAYQQECGRRSWASSRLLEADESLPHEFPWMAYLDINFDDGSPNTCSGTLISDSWILTAARCVYDSSYVTVTLGAHNISSAKETGRQYFTVTPQDYKIHPNWCSKANLEYDIALLRLPQQANFSEAVSPACLPFNGDSDQVNDPVILTGWGVYSSVDADSGMSSVLRQVNSTVISSAGRDGQCQSETEGNFSGDYIICADGSKGNRFCYGDEGGPMNYYNPISKSWFVIGVAGYSYYSSYFPCPHSVLPNIYVRVRSFLDWIETWTGIGSITPTETTSTSVTTTSTSTTTTARTTTTTSMQTTTTTRHPNFDCTTKPNDYTTEPNLSVSKCGVAYYPPSSQRIVGGYCTWAYEFPWQVYLTTPDRSHICTGSLISDQWILTSASCVKGRTSIEVFLGVYRLDDAYEATRESYVSTQLFFHPGYDGTFQRNDIGLVKLPTTVRFTSAIRPICLPPADEPSHEWDDVVLTGWGDNTINTTTTTVETTTTTYNNYNVSNDYFRRNDNYYITEDPTTTEETKITDPTETKITDPTETITTDPTETTIRPTQDTTTTKETTTDPTETIETTSVTEFDIETTTPSTCRPNQTPELRIFSSKAKPNTTLQKVNTSVIPKFECQQAHGGIVTHKHICTTGEHGGICQGDFGGPMNYRRTSNSTWVQIGIASFRYATHSVPDPYCSSDAPYVFTRVSSYLRWIYTVTGLPDPDNPIPRTQTTTLATTKTTVSERIISSVTNSSSAPTTYSSTESPTATTPNLALNLRLDLFSTSIFGTKDIVLPLVVTTAFILVVSSSLLKP